jgi:hypothetical protein
MRRALALAMLGIAGLFAGSLALLRALTDTGTAPPPAPVVARRVAPWSRAVAPARTGRAAEAPRPVAPRRRAPGAIRISFQLDPRLTKGLHMGNRWVSPPTYVSSQSGGVFTLRARAEPPAPGTPDPTWLTSAPDMVAVSSDRGSEVEITVLRAGESDLRVSAGDSVKTLKVRAQRQADAWRVEVVQ